jgi:EAL domain-containing protein (putative c-di-GMP-specific phosphodiesterase class I)
LQQFEVYYQPIVDLDTGHIHKSEALLRWKHPEHGFISPAVFIPIAEETGTINDIGDWVFMQVVQQAKRWQSGHHRDLQISVNKSPVQFMQDDRVHNNWIEHLREMELPGSGIVIEITESLLMSTDAHVTDKLLMFRDAGIQVAIDDFGTGYSSLAYIKKFDIDYLKIDQSFTVSLAADSSDFALCEAIVVMAHKLGIKVIAEGVETEQQRDLLQQIGCDYGQGFLFSRPVPTEDFEKLLAQG